MLLETIAQDIRKTYQVETYFKQGISEDQEKVELTLTRTG